MQRRAWICTFSRIIAAALDRPGNAKQARWLNDNHVHHFTDVRRLTGDTAEGEDASVSSVAATHNLRLHRGPDSLALSGNTPCELRAGFRTERPRYALRYRGIRLVTYNRCPPLNLRWRACSATLPGALVVLDHHVHPITDLWRLTGDTAEGEDASVSTIAATHNLRLQRGPDSFALSGNKPCELRYTRNRKAPICLALSGNTPCLSARNADRPETPRGEESPGLSVW